MEQFAVIRWSVFVGVSDETLFCGSYQDCLNVLKKIKNRRNVDIIDVNTRRLVSWVLK